MPQVEGGLRKNRAARLRELGEAQVEKHMRGLIGKTLPVLVESGNKGHTEWFSAVTLDRDVAQGQIVNVRMESLEAGFLKGTVR
jgi:threonylcarbamoyladenosine tRNA methylthiotransferase MtaB